MSRLIVKNLPKTITTEKLHEIFSEKGIVTDVQLKYTKDGRFRQFGFVGFKTEEEAENAVLYFNNSCIKASRIKVELCAGLGDPSKPKAWSRYAPDSSAFKKQHGVFKEKEIEENNRKSGEEKKKDSKVQELVDKHKNDPLFVEFMETHAKGTKALWSNDTLLNEDSKNIRPEKEPSLLDADDDSGHESNVVSESEDEEEVKGNIAKKKISDLEYLKMKTVREAEEDNYLKKEKGDHLELKLENKPQMPSVQFFTVKVRGLAYKAKKKDVKQFFHPLKPKSVRLPPKSKGIAYVGFKSEKEVRQALIKHLTFLAGKRIMVTKYVEKDTISKTVTGRDSSKWKNQEENLKNEETIAESGRIFVRNLAYTISEDNIEQLFSKFGPITEVIMPVDRNTRKVKGYAVVTFLVPENAARAFMELDGSIFHGRMLHLLPGKAKQSLEELMEKEGMTFKQKQLLKKKAEAASSHNWNTLFLGQNAVADLIAETYNTTKDKVLDSSGKQSVAVRLALGETQIVSQIREVLEESGVHLDAFNQAPKQRSKTVILVKNLPARTSLTEIQQIFMKYGELGRVVMPPTGVTAIVEFLEPSEAKIAFTKLAYTKFKHLPLYLEWAPSDTFKMPSSKPSKENKTLESSEEGGNSSKENVSAETGNSSGDSSDEDEPPEPDTTLFIKNLNFSTNQEDIREHFKKCGPVHEVSVAMKKDPKNPGQLLSLGYGFIQFKKRAGTEKALKTLQQSVLNEHAIELKRSNRTMKTEVHTTRIRTKIGKQTGTKILIRNIPFQATRNEVMDLFKTFGELKALRLPKKMVGTGSHRGFAFVDYYTKHDAKRAFKTLCQSTHLYGRRLVLEWAAAEENVEELRKRTAENFSEGPLHKTLKKSIVTHDANEDLD
ncbi:probable RNA-binding protein 19 isoform X2 [Zootermopsis nevadensis]|uniref:probable RNA-binding protein 19 isoform X2 n=1 Tax=Zootermopsis nevadensis TaxID=136037 RepID=UPI000B8E75E2|nr:probable RNA-binding protein 19 isoform X2 [Zootermopsis nevadensis]